MAKPLLREQAIEMRKHGMSYSQIKEHLNVSKGTLSIWLKEYPLSSERINELRGWSERRIERCRETKARKRADRLQETGEKMRTELGALSGRESFLMGLMLYWAEGTKAARGTICMTNTDPAMIEFFMRWLTNQGVPRSRLKVKLHLYADMDIRKETSFWKAELSLQDAAFKKPYVKASNYNKRVNYKGRFDHGTCNVLLNDISLYEKLMAGIEHIRNVSWLSGVRDTETV